MAEHEDAFDPGLLLVRSSRKLVGFRAKLLWVVRELSCAPTGRGCPLDLIEGWRAWNALTPGYHPSRLRRDECGARFGSRRRQESFRSGQMTCLH